MHGTSGKHIGQREDEKKREDRPDALVFGAWTIGERARNGQLLVLTPRIIGSTVIIDIRDW